MRELLTALDVENKAFGKVLRGYDPLEVDEFLDKVAESLHDHVGRCKRLEQERQLVEDQLKEYTNLKNSLQEALLMAQRSADDKIKAAKDQGEAIIAEARVKAEQVIFEASSEREHIRREVNHLRSIKKELGAELASIISRFQVLLEGAEEEEYQEERAD
ncbi:MAG TPA: DivIVA domain-containing protein [Synergistales bacterium]|nr:DivIVA domain-containing protein [Synergistales bacterium]